MSASACGAAAGPVLRAQHLGEWPNPLQLGHLTTTSQGGRLPWLPAPWARPAGCGGDTTGHRSPCPLPRPVSTPASKTT